MPVSPALPETPPEKRRYVRAMFSDIAPRYDLLNTILSLNIHRSWHRAVVARLGWEERPEGRYLDACAGTLELAADLARQPRFRGHVVATDFALPMLRLGAAKPRARAVASAAADTLRLPISDSSLDGAMVGFGLRNLSELDEGLAELARVLKPGGRLVILDFATPHLGPLRALYLWYFRRVLPVVGRLISGHPTAYAYLPESVKTFPDPRDLTRRMEAAGLGRTGYELLTGGIVAVCWGVR